MKGNVTMFKSVLVLVAMVLGSPSFALKPPVLKKIPLVALSAESEPGKSGKIGIYVDADNKISKMFYIDSDLDEQSYPLSSLSTYQTLVKKKGYDLVKVKSGSYSDYSASFTLRYYTNALTGSSKTIVISVSYNKRLGKYEALDSNQRPITRAHATTHQNMVGMAVGIEDILTYQ